MNNTYQIDSNEKSDDIINKPYLFLADLSDSRQLQQENNIDNDFQTNKIKNLVLKSNQILYCPINNSYYHYDYITQNINNLIKKLKK